jgi:hypothetical protein
LALSNLNNALFTLKKLEIGGKKGYFFCPIVYDFNQLAWPDPQSLADPQSPINPHARKPNGSIGGFA